MTCTYPALTDSGGRGSYIGLFTGRLLWAARKKPMTANAFADDVRESTDSGMDAHIAKPVRRDILLATIKQGPDR